MRTAAPETTLLGMLDTSGKFEYFKSVVVAAAAAAAAAGIVVVLVVV
jgi:hypothetical protein